MPPNDKPTRRRPLKRIKLAGSAITVQRLKGGKFAVVVHRPDGSRSKKEFPSQAEAVTEYDLRCREAERLGVSAAVQVGDNEKRACLDFMAATALWTPRPSVADALTYYIEQKQALAASGTVNDACERRKSDALRRGLSKRHKQDLDNRLDRFQSSFGSRPLASITTEEISGWLDGLNVAPQTMRNFLTIVSSVFADAVREGRLISNPAVRVRPPKVIRKEPGIITAGQLRKLLDALPDRSRAVVAILSLAGLRVAEALRLDWKHVKHSDRLITLDASIAKTSDRRHVPISGALAAWLVPLTQKEGKVAPTEGQLRGDMEAARLAAGITDWPENALRHTCISAWAATEPNFAQVVQWVGHSAATSHKHYRALITREEAEAWIGTFPPGHKPAVVKEAAKPAKAKRGAGKGSKPAKPAGDTAPEPAAPLADVIEFPRAAG